MSDEFDTGKVYVIQPGTVIDYYHISEDEHDGGGLMDVPFTNPLIYCWESELRDDNNEVTMSCTEYTLIAYRYSRNYGLQKLELHEYYGYDDGELKKRTGSLDSYPVETSITKTSRNPVTSRAIYNELKSIKDRLDALEGGNS